MPAVELPQHLHKKVGTLKDQARLISVAMQTAMDPLQALDPQAWVVPLDRTQTAQQHGNAMKK
jgi:hypothetical protein